MFTYICNNLYPFQPAMYVTFRHEKEDTFFPPYKAFYHLAIKSVIYEGSECIHFVQIRTIYGKTKNIIKAMSNEY